MREIWIPELISSLLILVFLVRPLFKGLWPLDGIAWFPVLALGLGIILFPAYGFRPELVPLLAYQLFMTLTNLNPLLVGPDRNASFHEGSGLFLALSLVFLVLSTGVALWFAPLETAVVTARELTVRDPESSKTYTLYVYGEGEAPRPLIFAVPPEFGGAKAVDSICAALGDEGFTVISYDRRGLDSPAHLYRLWRSFSRGTVSQGANQAGRALEDEKLGEIRFILPYVLENLNTLAPGASRDALYLAGWGIGGSALAYLAAEPPARAPWSGNPAPAFGARGLLTVESRLFSVWEAAPPPFPVEAGGNPLLRALAAVQNWFAAFLPEKMAGPGAPPRPLVPTLYLASDWTFDQEQGSYAALFSSLRDSPASAALAALSGAGPLDYTDFPLRYPLYTALFPGRSEAQDRTLLPRDTAALFARFCALLAPGGAAAAPTHTAAPDRTEIQLETRYWNFGDLRLY
jgi:hypothetical protein